MTFYRTVVNWAWHPEPHDLGEAMNAPKTSGAPMIMMGG